MAMIVISHVAQTFGTGHSGLLLECHVSVLNDYFANFKFATSNMQYFIVALFRHFGALGNDIFFICSAWFLVDSHGKKSFRCFLMFG